MAITTEMRAQVSQMYVAMFGRAPDGEGLGFWAQKMGNGETIAQIADQMYATSPARAYYPDFLTNQEVISRFYVNVLGRTADTEGLNFWTAKLNAAGATQGSVIAEMVAVVAGYTGTDPDGLVSQQLFNNRAAVAQYYGEANLGVNGADAILATVTSDAATVVAAKAAVDANAVGSAGAFTLTNGTDTATANVFNAGLVYVPGGNDRINALQDEDVLTGTGTNPTLNATLGNANDNGGTTVTPKLSGIETINVGFTGSAGGAGAVNQLDLQDSANTGKEINITRISDGIVTATIDNISVASEKLSVSNSGQPGQNVGFLFKNAALNGAADATTLTIKDVQLGNLRVESRTPTAGIGFETINLVSSSDANTVGQFFAEDLETLNISGDANLTLGATGNVLNAGIVEATTLGAGLGNVQGSLKTVNAAELTGNLDITFNGEFNAGRDGTSGQNTALSVTGGKGNDTFRLNADTINTTDVVDGGEGTNTLVMTNGSVVNAAGTATAPVANVKKVQNLEVRAGHDNNVAADATVVNADAFDSLAAIYVRNEGQIAGASAAEVMTVTLNNLTAAQGTAITVAHGTTGNNTILNNVVNANLKTSTGTAETVGITLVDGTNADLRFNLQLSTNADVVTTAAVERVENISVTDNDTESNTVQLVNSAQNTGTITLKGGATGQYLNLDADGSNANGLSGYALVETGALGSGAQNAAGTAIATADTAVNAVISTVDYRVLNNGANADVRLIAENVNAADYVGDVIVRLGDVTRTDGISSMSVTGGAGNDSFIFDAQGVKNSGYTSGDTVKAGAGTDTLVIDGNTVPGVGGNVSVQKSEWDNTTGVDVLRLAGNQGVANGLAANVIAAGIVASNTNVGGYYIEIDNEFVKQTDAGNNLKIVSNDGDLATNLESDLVLNLRPLTQTSNVTFVGANSNLAAVGVNASNRLQVEDNSANGVNVLDGGDSVTDEAGTAATRVSSGNNNVLEVFNTADVSINDLSNTKNFGRIEGTNDLAVAQTLKLVLNDTVVDQLVDAGTAARATAVGAVPANVERLVVVANNNANVAGAVENLNIDASAVTNKFGLDVIADRGTTNTIVGTAGTDKVVLKGNFTAAEQVADGHAAVTLFAGANALTGAALTTAIAANGTAYKGVDGVAGTADDVLLAYAATYTNIETIETFGGVDLTGATLTAGTTIIAHSSVRLTEAQLNNLVTVQFVGNSAHGLQIVDSVAEASANLSRVTVSTAGATLNVQTSAGAGTTTGTVTIPAGNTAPTVTTGVTYGAAAGADGGGAVSANYTLTAGIDAFNGSAALVNGVSPLTATFAGVAGTTPVLATSYTIGAAAANLTSLDTLVFGTGTANTLAFTDAAVGVNINTTIAGAYVDNLDILQLANVAANTLTVTALGARNAGLTVKGGSGQDIITIAGANQAIKYELGGGNDVFDNSGNFTTTGVTVDGGAGTDTFNFITTAIATTATVEGGSGNDTLFVSTANAVAIDAMYANKTNIEIVKVAGTSTGHTLGANAFLAGIRTFETGAGALTVTPDTTFATLMGTNTLTINAAALADDADLTLGGTTATKYSITNLMGDLVATGNTGAITVALAANTNDAQTIATGSGGMTVTGGDATDVVTVTLSAAAQTFNASGSTSQFAVTTTANAQVILGGSSADVITVAAAGHTATITGGAGNDTIALGVGVAAQQVVFSATAALNGSDTITGFVTGSDKLNLDALTTDLATTAWTGALAPAAGKVYLLTGQAAGSADTAAAAAAALNAAVVASDSSVTSFIVISDDNSSAIYQWTDVAGSANEVGTAELTLIGTVAGSAVAAGDLLFA